MKTHTLFNALVLGVLSLFSVNMALSYDHYPYIGDENAMCGTLFKVNVTVSPTKNGDWSDATVWPGGSLPSAGDNVIIPSGRTVNLRGSVNVSKIKVEGTLKNSANRNFTVTCNEIMVVGNSAKLQIGTANTPYTGKGRFTLIGSDPGNDDGSGMGSKLIGLMDGGTMSLHGADVLTWTKLASDVVKGDDQITLAEPATSWKVGDEIVVAPSGFRVNETEEMVIKTISKDGLRLTLTKPFEYDHRGSIVQYDNNKSIDVRAEVGLLTRNIVIEAKDDADSSAGFGGHIMAMPGTFMYISGVELDRMGQKGKLGRYPIHWHLMGNVNGQYVKNSSIHKSFNRAVTIHQTNEVLVENNVIYDFIGHGFFLEDGNEVRNVFRKNFGVYAKIPKEGDRIEPNDNTVSVFWIAHPNNIYESNAVGGSERNGYWIVPKNRSKAQLSTFENNSVHTCRDGVAMDFALSNNKSLSTNSWSPEVNGKPATILVEGLTAYHCEKGFWTKIHSRGTVKLLNNSVLGGCQENGFISFTGEIKNTTIVGQIKGFNYSSMPGAPREYLGAQLYNGSCDFENIYLAGFEAKNTSSIGTRRASQKYPNFTMKNMMFDSTVPVAKRVDFNRPGGLTDPSLSYTFSTGIIDVDGSISGIVGGRLTPRIQSKRNDGGVFQNKVYDDGFNSVPGAKLFEDWGAYVTTGVDYGYLPLNMRTGLLRPSADHDVFYLHRSDGKSTFDRPRTGISSQIPVIVNNDNYHYRAQPERNCDFYDCELKWTHKNATAYLTIVNVPSNYSFSGNRVNSMEALRNATITSYFFENNELKMKHVATDDDTGNKNGSNYFEDWSGKSIRASRPANLSDLGTYLTLADFEAKENRFSIKKATNSSLTIPVISYSASGAFPLNNTSDDFLEFDFKTNGDGTNDYLDLEMNFDKQIWDLYEALSFKYDGPSVQVYARGNGAITDLGTYAPSNNRINIDLSITDESNDWRENITGLIFRIHESSIGNLNNTITRNIKLYDVRLHNTELTYSNLVSLNNVAPVISITSPKHLDLFNSTGSIQVTANATDTDANLDRVEFSVDGLVLSSDNSRPFEAIFTPSTIGVYEIGAKATDFNGAETEVFISIKVENTLTNQQSPFGGVAWAIPGIIEGEDFDTGGEGVSYSDTDARNRGNSNYRSGEGVDIIPLNNGNMTVSHTANGEWLEYSVLVEETANYNLQIVYSSGNPNGGAMSLELDNGVILPSVSLPYTGAWSTFVTSRQTLELDEGEHILKAKIDQGGFNLDKMAFEKSVVSSTDNFNNSASVQVYPNPSENGLFYLNKKINWEVFNSQGKRIESSDNLEINLSNSGKGVYFLKTSKNVFKIVVE